MDYRFHTRPDTLTDRKAVAWKTVLSRSLKVGIELEAIEPEGADVGEIIRELKQRLKPSKDNRRLGETGVLTVARERYGFEVKVVGRNPIFDRLLEHVRAIYGHMAALGCFPTGACGMHNHLIAVHLGEDLPSIVLANLWNLTRWHAPALRFITSCGPTRDRLTRMSECCDHRELMRLDPADLPMPALKQALEAADEVRTHYNFFNLESVAFRGTGDISAFHFEYRFPDMDMSPLGAVAKSFLFFALTLRAVELSKYGLLALDESELAARSRLLDMLSNQGGDDSMSDTSALGDAEFARLQRQTVEMVRSLKPMFTFFDPTAYRILSLLAMTPVSLLRAAGNDWQDIDAILASTVFAEDVDRRLIAKIAEVIELFRYTGCEAKEQWLHMAAWDLGISRNFLAHMLQHLGYARQARWDPELGAIIFHNR